MHGTTNERTISVSSSRPMHTVNLLTDSSEIAGEHRQHGDREHKPATSPHTVLPSARMRPVFNPA